MMANEQDARAHVTGPGTEVPEPGPREASWWGGWGLAERGGGKLSWYLEQPGLAPFLGTPAAALGRMKGSEGQMVARTVFSLEDDAQVQA